MPNDSGLETIACPYCAAREHEFWARELGFNAVRCAACALIFVNPRPSSAAIATAVNTGFHASHNLSVVSRHDVRKVARYRRILGQFFADRWSRGQPLSWLDIGAGYGEIIEALSLLAPPGSQIEGLEPMQPKADHARSRGLRVTQEFLAPSGRRVDIVSLVDVFSHIPDFSSFLAIVRSNLKEGGELFMETGNLADLVRRDEFPGELGLPDHLVFAGERQLRGFLEREGFEIVRLEGVRIDGVVNLAKSVVKKLLGRPVTLAVPYTSHYRQLLVRAKLKKRDRVDA